MPSPEESIVSALFGGLASVTFSPAIPVVYPGMVYPPAGQQKAETFIMVQDDDNTPDRVFIGSDDPHRYHGFLTVSVCSPLNKGVIEPIRLAAQIADKFKADAEFIANGIRVRSMRRPSIIKGYRDDGEARWRTPVVIEFEAWA